MINLRLILSKLYNFKRICQIQPSSFTTPQAAAGSGCQAGSNHPPPPVQFQTPVVAGGGVVRII